MGRQILFFLCLFLAAVSDLKSRNIPDWMPCLIAASSLFPPGRPNIAGLVVCLPLFTAGITAGGIGGGDIKLTAACGIVLGFHRAFTGLFLALCLLAVWHSVYMAAGKIRRKKRNWKRAGIPASPFSLDWDAGKCYISRMHVKESHKDRDYCGLENE